MTTLTDKMEVLETQLAAQNATIAAYIDTVEAKLQAALDMLDIMNENNAANTKYLLAALSQTGACFPCPSPPMIVPPIGTTEGPINSDRCKRAQAIIAVIHALLANMDTMQSFNVIGTYNVVAGAISDYIGTIAAGDTVPLPSAPEAINIVGDYVSYAGERVFSGIGLVEQFEPLETDLIAAIVNTTTPGAAQSSYNSLIEASGVSNGARLLFEAIAYTALWSYYFDPDSTPDLSAYDGSLCGIAECFSLTAVESHFPGFTTYAIDWTGEKTCVDVTDTGYTSDHCSWCTENMDGWTASSDDGDLYIFEQFHSSRIDTGPGSWSHTFTDTGGLFIGRLSGSGPFTIEFCPPA